MAFDFCTLVSSCGYILQHLWAFKEAKIQIYWITLLGFWENKQIPEKIKCFKNAQDVQTKLLYDLTVNKQTNQNWKWHGNRKISVRQRNCQRNITFSSFLSRVIHLFSKFRVGCLVWCSAVMTQFKRPRKHIVSMMVPMKVVNLGYVCVCVHMWKVIWKPPHNVKVREVISPSKLGFPHSYLNALSSGEQRKTMRRSLYQDYHS